MLNRDKKYNTIHNIVIQNNTILYKIREYNSRSVQCNTNAV